TKELVGSMDYMAPEQAAGEEADPVSDIYALGVVLFEMLTGRLPYTGRNEYDVMMKKSREAAPPADDLVREVPPALADLVANCLASRPESRIRSMRVLEVELLRSLDAPPTGRTGAHAAIPRLAGDSNRTGAHAPVPRSPGDSGMSER